MIYQIGGKRTKKITQIQMDKEDHDTLIKNGYGFYLTEHGYIRVQKYTGKKDGKYTYDRNYLHRAITKAPKNLMVDHINGDRTDNRRSNLRLCMAGANARNAKKANGKYKGVHQIKTSKRWTAQITKDYKCHHLGCFGTQEEAALAYNKAAKRLHGKYAFLNEIV